MAKPYLSRSQRDSVVKELQSDNQLTGFIEHFGLTEMEKSQVKRTSRQKLHLRSIARAPPFGLCQRRVIAVALSKVLPISKLYDAYDLFDVLDVMSDAAVSKLKALRSTETCASSKESTPAPDQINEAVSIDTNETSVVGVTDNSVAMSVDSTALQAVSAPDLSSVSTPAVDDMSVWKLTAAQLIGTLPQLEPLTPGQHECAPTDAQRASTSREQSVEQEPKTYANVVKRGRSQVEPESSSLFTSSASSVEEGRKFPVFSAQQRKRMRASPGLSGKPVTAGKRLVAGTQVKPGTQTSLSGPRRTTAVVSAPENSAAVNRSALVNKGNLSGRTTSVDISSCQTKPEARRGVNANTIHGILPATCPPKSGRIGQQSARTEIETDESICMAQGRDKDARCGRSIRIIVSADMLSEPLTIYLG